jgi:hypothetical protein
MEDEERTFAAKDFDKFILEMADAALKKKFKNLSKKDHAAIESDRADIERGTRHLKHGLALRSSNDPDVLRDSGWFLMVGACAICSRANVSGIVKKYLAIESHGTQGDESAKTRQENMANWQGKVLKRLNERLGEKPKLSGEAAARLIEKDIPDLPIGHRRLVEFIQGELRRRKHDNW